MNLAVIPRLMFFCTGSRHICDSWSPGHQVWTVKKTIFPCKSLRPKPLSTQAGGAPWHDSWLTIRSGASVPRPLATPETMTFRRASTDQRSKRLVTSSNVISKLLQEMLCHFEAAGSHEDPPHWHPRNWSEVACEEIWLQRSRPPRWFSNKIIISNISPLSQLTALFWSFSLEPKKIHPGIPASL